MNITIIDHVGEKAGMDYYSSSLAKGMLSQNCKPSVYSNFVGMEAGEIEYRPYFEGHSKKNSVVKLYRLLHATVKASVESKREKSELVIVHLFSANVVTLLLVAIPKLFSLKTAIISHDVSSFADNDNTFMQNLIYNTFSDIIIVHNNFSYDALLQNVKIQDPAKVKVIKHGGYLDHIGERPDRDALRESLGLEPTGKYILFFGQIKKVKGLDVLLEAMSQVPNDIKLIIAGKPWKDDFAQYDRLIDKHGLTERVVKMVRFIEDDEREKLFFAADVIVLPYRVIFQSGVLLMAMSHGLPVIASDLAPNKEIITHKKHAIFFIFMKMWTVYSNLMARIHHSY
jgi:D-inositol-3-phosphate glycosyltransferase